MVIPWDWPLLPGTEALHQGQRLWHSFARCCRWPRRWEMAAQCQRVSGTGWVWVQIALLIMHKNLVWVMKHKCDAQRWGKGHRMTCTYLIPVFQSNWLTISPACYTLRKHWTRLNCCRMMMPEMPSKRSTQTFLLSSTAHAVDSITTFRLSLHECHCQLVNILSLK